MLTVFAAIIVILTVSGWACYRSVQAEAHVRYVGIMKVTSEKIGKTIRGMEMNAENVFDEVSKHLDSPETVVEALGSKIHLNPDVGGYFAAFDPCYFTKEKKWFEPYVHHHNGGEFELSQVGSDQHDYTQSGWYVRALETKESFWSDPYIYDDGTEMTGHYFTYVKPVYDKTGRLACVCGADMTFEWLLKEMKQIDDDHKQNSLLNRYRMDGDFDFYSVIIDSDGYCIAHPEDKTATIQIKDAEVLRNLEQKKSGVFSMELKGEPCSLYYGAIDYINWTVAIVVPESELMRPLWWLGGIFLLITLLCLLLIWTVCRRLSFEVQSQCPDY